MICKFTCFALSAISVSASIHGLKKDMCGFIKIPLLCASSSIENNFSSNTLALQNNCSDSSCCRPSRCYSIPGPLFKCRADRGPTTCEAARMIPFRSGTCKCKYGACSIGGECPDQDGQLRLYEVNSGYVQPEDFTFPFILLGFLGGTLVLGAMNLVMRLRSRPRQVRVMELSPKPQDTDPLLEDAIE